MVCCITSNGYCGSCGSSYSSGCGNGGYGCCNNYGCNYGYGGGYSVIYPYSWGLSGLLGLSGLSSYNYAGISSTIPVINSGTTGGVTLNNLCKFISFFFGKLMQNT